MQRTHPSEITSVRLTAGMYALSKLACAGLSFLLLSLVILAYPTSNGSAGEEWPVSAAYAIYAYGLPAALVADGLLRLLRIRLLALAFVVYAVAGLGAGLWLAAEQGGTPLLCAVAGIIVLLLFRTAQIAVERLPLLLPVFALFVPLLCLVLS
ncbi:hypothetical protein ACFRAM_18720 [Paenibacillus sp. NPDC056722]|uniref:hypothetical protein n=1 Tax=Paenibacillus sp. NPDC056722 TaxID=3345924 RepID=UPI00367513CA